MFGAATPGACASASLTWSATSASATTSTGATRPGGSKRSRISSWPWHGLRRVAVLLGEVEIAAPVEVAERAERRAPRAQTATSSTGRRRTSVADPRPARARPRRLGSSRGIAGQNARRPNAASSAGSSVSAAGHHHDDPEREQRAHLARRVEVGEAEHEHRRDHDPAGGEDRRAGARGRAHHRRLDVVAAPQLVAEARHDQQAVVRARAEHQHDQDRRRLAADRRHVGLRRARRPAPVAIR